MTSVKIKKPRTNSKGKIDPKKMLSLATSYSQELEEELEDKGVVFFQPNDELDSSLLVLPPDITEVPTKSLGQYLNAFTQQKMYMRTLIGWSEMKEEDAKMEYVGKSNEKYTSLTLDKKLSETAKDRLLDGSAGDFMDEKRSYLKYKQSTNLLKMNLASIEDAIFLISREVSRRTGDFAQENRDHNVSNR